MTQPEFLDLVKRALGVDDDVTIDPTVPLGEQLEVESARMIELTIVLEEELRLDLDDDVDLRRETGAGLYASLP